MRDYYKQLFSSVARHVSQPNSHHLYQKGNEKIGHCFGRSILFSGPGSARKVWSAEPSSLPAPEHFIKQTRLVAVAALLAIRRRNDGSSWLARSIAHHPQTLQLSFPSPCSRPTHVLSLSRVIDRSAPGRQIRPAGVVSSADRVGGKKHARVQNQLMRSGGGFGEPGNVTETFR